MDSETRTPEFSHKIQKFRSGVRNKIHKVNVNLKNLMLMLELLELRNNRENPDENVGASPRFSLQTEKSFNPI